MNSSQCMNRSQHSVDSKQENIINQTRRLVKNMTVDQRFSKAKCHIFDALQNRQPRPQVDQPDINNLYNIFYLIRTSSVWRWSLSILSYFYLYLAALDNQAYFTKIGIQSSILFIFILDMVMDFYCKSFALFKKEAKYPIFVFLKVVLIILMIIDVIIFSALPCYGVRPFRPFRLLRAGIPICYSKTIRSSVIALASTYKVMISYLIFDAIIICSWALVGTAVIDYDKDYTGPNIRQPVDHYRNDYSSLSTMIYDMYALNTYDSYPENQTLSFQNSLWNAAFWWPFIFLNFIIFASIPGSIIYNKFRETQSKFILIDEIKSQHSLILAFTTLAQEQNSLSMEKFITFLFYFYKKKVRYIEYIAQICIRLDNNNNGSIQVSQFMELSKILLYNSAMYPPIFQDLNIWMKFRQKVNTVLCLKQIVNSLIFQTVISITVILAFINAWIYVTTSSETSIQIDNVLIWIFVFQIILRIIADGTQIFFGHTLDKIDFFLAILSAVLFLWQTQKTFNIILRMYRIYRFFNLIKKIEEKYQCLHTIDFQVFRQFSQILLVVFQILPIIATFLQMFILFQYTFGIMGMEIFYNTEQIPLNSDNPYGSYIEFSNFKNFINTQFIMMQILTEGGWSMFPFYYSWITPSYYGWIVLYFVLNHFFIVTTTLNLVKGIVWEIFFTVSQLIRELEEKKELRLINEAQTRRQQIQFQEINELISKNQYIDPNSIIKRELIQKKMDSEIILRIKHLTECQSPTTPKRRYRTPQKQNLRVPGSMRRSKLAHDIIDNWNLNSNERIEGQKSENMSQQQRSVIEKIKKDMPMTMSVQNLGEKQQINIEAELEDLLSKLIINPKIRFTEIIAYPKIFVQKLKEMLVLADEITEQQNFNFNKNILSKGESMAFHVFEMNALTGIGITAKQIKSEIVGTLKNSKMIDRSTGNKVMKKKFVEKGFHINTQGVLNKMYLADTNEDMKKKLQVQYFSDVYGNSFKQINKITLNLLLKFQASLTFSLRNIMRYPNINYKSFFNLLTHIQQQISNKLLKRGSLFKFVYKVDHQSDVWFMVDGSNLQEMNIRFIKNGLWFNTRDMQQHKTYLAKDLFNWDLSSTPQSANCQSYLKKFYQSFQTLALGLVNKQLFFEANPQGHIYDLYIQQFQTKSLQRTGRLHQLKISSISLVVLVKQQERADIGSPNLKYSLTDIKCQPRKKKQFDFKFGEEQKQTYEKLKKLVVLDQEKIIETEGLPFAYIVNLMQEISDINRIYSENFVDHIEEALNRHYHEAKLKHAFVSDSNENIDLFDE